MSSCAGRTGKAACEYESDLVVSVRAEAADGVALLTLRHPDDESLPQRQPSAHIDLPLADGLARNCSSCGAPGDRTAWRIGVLRLPDGRGGSAYVHDKLHVGTQVRLRSAAPCTPAR
ncbi:hypothetical protein GCM10009680_43520 [Streptomyces yatensis]|uniref:Uncharacterized protein n=1 Tax=Streptomyces yatensis TaxID=155177 RepID=A0ABN2I4J3_9ACTN